MADRALVITWGEVVRGREERAIENFNEAVGYYGRKQQEGKVESIDVTLLFPNAMLGGFLKVEGTAEQLAALKEDPEFQRITAASQLIVDHLSLIDGVVNEGVAEQMAIYAEVTSKVPQSV